MVDTKEVTGVICLPLPALSRGRHTLSTTYIDGKYVTKNKCFEIQVVSATVNIDAGNGEEGRPNTTAHFVIEVTNEKGQPVKDGQVKMYYDANQVHPWAEQYVATKNTNVEIDGANIVGNGRCTIDFDIPNDFRACLFQLRFRYDLSHEGYDDKSIEVPLYVYRDGALTLDFSFGQSFETSQPIDISYDEDRGETYYNMLPNNKLYCIAQVDDGSDANCIGVPDVPVNFKMNAGTIGNKNTDNNGVVTMETPTISSTVDNFMIYVKSQAKKYIGELEGSQKIYVGKQATLKQCFVDVVNADGESDLGVNVSVTNENGEPLAGRPVMLKLNNSSVPSNGNFFNPDATKVVRTNSSGEAFLGFEYISLGVNRNYTLEVNIGGGYKVLGLKKELGSIKWQTNTMNQYEYNNGSFELVDSQSLTE